MPSHLYKTVIPYDVFSERLRQRQEQAAETPVRNDRQMQFEHFIGQMVTSIMFIAGAVKSALDQSPGEVIPITMAKSYHDRSAGQTYEPNIS